MRTLLSLLCLLTLGASAAESVPPPEGQGEFEYCLLCHGTGGGGNPMIDAPRIGGLPAWYLENQLHAFREGRRAYHEEDYHGGEMRPMAVALTEEQIPRVAAWFAAFDVPTPPETVAGDVEAGARHYATCAICHGAGAEGNASVQAPPLKGQSDWYLVRQIEHFRAGRRGAAPGDALGSQMRAMVSVLGDEQAVRDVVAYIDSLD